MTDESSAGGGGAILRPPDDWNDWVSASKLRGYLLGNTLGDWLDLYGKDHGFVRDNLREGYDERLDFSRFTMERGIAFEKAVAAWLADRADLLKIGESGPDSQDFEKAKGTLAALKDGREIVHQGILWNSGNRTYGAPDFLIRSDVFDRLFPEHLDPGEAERSAPGLDRPWHYLVVDAKFATLTLGKERKNVSRSGTTPAYMGQLHVYNAALGRLQGLTPPRAFLLGRGYRHKYRRNKQDHWIIGSSAVERLGQVPMNEGLRKQVAAAADWIRRLRREGGDWSPLPEASVPELECPREGAAPWAHAIKDIASRQRQGRNATQSRSSGPVVEPPRITASEEVWRERQPCEFFVDFETVNDLNDDFSRFPEKGGQAMIFMIGCGHMEDGGWRFRCFVAAPMDASGERQIVNEWLAHMKEIGRRYGVKLPKVFHWASAERTWYESACDRHSSEEWPVFNGFDLLQEVFRAQPVSVRDADDQGLKTVAKALHHHGKIETSWGDSTVDGQGAMVGAWHCDRDAAEKGIRLEETALMQEIREYNQVDCRVMQEILDYLRKNH